MTLAVGITTASRQRGPWQRLGMVLGTAGLLFAVVWIGVVLGVLAGFWLAGH